MFLRKLESNPEKLKELSDLGFLKNNKFNKKLRFDNLNERQRQFIDNLLNKYPILKNYNLSGIILMYLKDIDFNDLYCYANKFGITCNKPRKLKSSDLSYFCEDHAKDKKLVTRQKVQTEKKVLLEKYGVDNVSKLDTIKEKKKQRFLEKYGVDNPMKAPEIQENLKKSYLEKYGVEWIIQAEEVKNKIKNTIKEKYGVDNVSKLDTIKEKKKQKFLEKYGVDNPSKAPEVQEKIKKTNLEKYGVEWSISAPEVQEKIKRTNIERYGVERALKSPEVQEKIKKTNLEKYGAAHPRQAHLKNLDKLNKDYIEKHFLDDNKRIKLNEFKSFYGYSQIQLYSNLKKLNIEYKKRSGTSNYEEEIINFIKEFYSGEIIQNDRSIIKPKELDIYIPEHNLAIEFNGLFWHSINSKDQIKYFKFKHLEKTKACEEKGINLLHIFENEWLDPIKQDIWKSIIKYKLKAVTQRYYARNLEIKILTSNKDKKLVRNFFDENHLQGGGAIGSILIGGFNKKTGELISCMTFGKSRYNKEIGYELIRFASKKYSSCIGCASKLFKYFVSNFDPKSIVSYANRRWASKNANLYSTIGLKFVGESEPNYFYFKPNDSSLRLYPRITFQKHKLKDHPDTKNYYNKLLTESEIMFAAGFRRIYDAGNLIFHWKKDQK